MKGKRKSLSMRRDCKSYMQFFRETQLKGISCGTHKPYNRNRYTRLEIYIDKNKN